MEEHSALMLIYRQWPELMRFICIARGERKKVTMVVEGKVLILRFREGKCVGKIRCGKGANEVMQMLAMYF